MATPLREQYLRIKERYPDLLVLFQIGDFYEAFDEDARLLAQELGVTLTRKWFGKDDVHPLAGVPVRSLDAHLAKLIRRGLRVVVCDQVTEPGKGLVEREVVRIVTPGTVIEPGLLSGRESSYLASLVVRGPHAALAFADVTTGEFQVAEITAAQVLPELSRLGPAELLLPAGTPLPHPDDASGSAAAEPRPRYGGRAGALLTLDSFGAACAVTELPPEQAAEGAARAALLSHFATRTLLAYGCEDRPLCTQAAGALVAYLRATQPEALTNLTALRRYHSERYMQLDAQTLNNLEVLRATDIEGPSRAGSLIALIDHAATPMGGRLLRAWLRHPLLDLDELTARQDAVQWFFHRPDLRAEITRTLAEVLDLERILGRVRRRLASPGELAALAGGLRAVQRLCVRLQALDAAAPLVGAPLRDSRLFSELGEVAALIERALADSPPTDLLRGGVIRAGYSAELDELRGALQGGRRFLSELEARERQRTGIKSLKVGHNKVFGYYIEVTRPNLHLVPEDYIRKQTLTSAERFFTMELKEHELLVANARARLLELEQSLYRQLCEDVGAHREALLTAAESAAQLDVLVTLAEVAAQRGYARPQLTGGDELHIRGGRHPMLEAALPRFVPNDTDLGGREGAPQLMLITAPNMAGKSVYLRQVALLCLLAQVGSFVPAESARIGLTDRIFTRIGLTDYMLRGQSSFMAEMVETAHILHHAGPRSLIILDEVGRGTAVADGLAIARALVEHLHNHPRLGARTLFATHYHELADCAAYLPRMRNYHLRVEPLADGGMRYHHQVLPGVAGRSFGVQVAQMAGMPPALLRRARELLKADAPPPADAPDPRDDRAAALRATLQALDLDVLSPVEALTKLYELKRALLPT